MGKDGRMEEEWKMEGLGRGSKKFEEGCSRQYRVFSRRKTSSSRTLTELLAATGQPPTSSCAPTHQQLVSTHLLLAAGRAQGAVLPVPRRSVPRDGGGFVVAWLRSDLSRAPTSYDWLQLLLAIVTATRATSSQVAGCRKVDRQILWVPFSLGRAPSTGSTLQ